MKATDPLQSALRRLERMDNAVGSARLSGIEVQSEGGKAAMMAIASSASREDFDPDAIRHSLIQRLRA